MNYRSLGICHKGNDILPIPGTKKIKYLESNAKAVDVVLNNQEMNEIERIAAMYPNVGERY